MHPMTCLTFKILQSLMVGRLKNSRLKLRIALHFYSPNAFYHQDQISCKIELPLKVITSVNNGIFYD